MGAFREDSDVTLQSSRLLLGEAENPQNVTPPNDQYLKDTRPRVVGAWSVRATAFAAVLALGGCPCIRGAVNASPGLRWWLFSHFGASRMCPEMLKRGAGLSLVPGGNTLGRFFPDQCSAQPNDTTQTLTLSFSGSGYGWTPIAGRASFTVQAAIEYRMDFYMASDAVYVWAKVGRVVNGPEFRLTSVENTLVNWAAQGPGKYLASTYGQQIVSSQLASGFTVVHTDEGDEFALGLLQPPMRPPKPFDTSQGHRYVFANETTEIRTEQVDFLGPFTIEENDQALFLKLRAQGPITEALVLYRGTGDLWRKGLEMGQPLAPPPAPPVLSFILTPGREEWKRIPLAAGQYYLVIDNSSRVGTVKPPWNPLSLVGTNSAVLSYSAELGGVNDDW